MDSIQGDRDISVKIVVEDLNQRIISRKEKYGDSGMSTYSVNKHYKSSRKTMEHPSVN